MYRPIGHKILGHRLVINYPLIIAKTQCLLSWLPNDYSSITYWCRSSRLVMSGNLASILILHYPPMQAFLGVHVFRRTKYVRRNTSWEAKSWSLHSRSHIDPVVKRASNIDYGRHFTFCFCLPPGPKHIIHWWVRLNCRIIISVWPWIWTRHLMTKENLAGKKDERNAPLAFDTTVASYWYSRIESAALQT